MDDSKAQTAFPGGELADELKSMVGESLQSSSKAFLRSMNLFRAVAKQMPQQKIGALDMARNWARINLETSRIISRHSQEAVSEILDTLEQFGLVESRPCEEPCSESKQQPRDKVIIELEARRGQKASTLFVVSNPGPKTMHATFSVSEFVNEDGHVVGDVKASFAPPELKLLPNQETTVEISIEVSNKCKVGTCYRSNISIPEYPGKEIILHLQVNRARAAGKGKTKAKKA